MCFTRKGRKGEANTPYKQHPFFSLTKKNKNKKKPSQNANLVIARENTPRLVKCVCVLLPLQSSNSHTACIRMIDIGWHEPRSMYACIHWSDLRDVRQWTSRLPLHQKMPIIMVMYAVTWDNGIDLTVAAVAISTAWGSNSSGNQAHLLDAFSCGSMRVIFFCSILTFCIG